MKKRIISLFMGLLMAFTMIFVPMSLSINISALSPTYTMSTSYKNSKYYKNLTGLELTGDQRTDIVRVALTQLGYHEGNSNSDFHGGNSSGSKNFVEYNRLHGLIDNNEGNGLSYGYYWCASFATWCANQAGISVSDIKKSVSCRDLVTFFTNNGTYKTRASGYVPKSGDIILFKDSGSSVSSTHTGIVLYSSGGKVYTVEGNASSVNAVALKEYSLNDTYIVGYGSPSMVEKSSEKIDFSMSGGYLLGDYVVKASSTALKKSVSNSSSTVATAAIGDMLRVTQISGSYGKVAYGQSEAWVKLSDLCIVSVQKYTLSYDVNGASSSISTSNTESYNKKFKITTTVPKREGYVFLGWAESKSASEAQYSSGESITLTKDTVLYAVWQRNTFVIKFYDYDGTLISTQYYKLGDTVNEPSSEPSRHSDGVYNYTFIGWDSEIVPVSGDKNYTAVYRAVPIPTLDNTNDADGSVSDDVPSTDGDGTVFDDSLSSGAGTENGEGDFGESNVGGADDDGVDLGIAVGCTSSIALGASLMIATCGVSCAFLARKKKD